MYPSEPTRPSNLLGNQSANANFMFEGDNLDKHKEVAIDWKKNIYSLEGRSDLGRVAPDDALIPNTSWIEIPKKLKKAGWNMPQLIKLARQITRFGYSTDSLKPKAGNLGANQLPLELIETLGKLQSALLQSSEYPNGLDISEKIAITASGKAIIIQPPKGEVECPVVVENEKGEFKTRTGKITEESYECALYIGQNVPFGKKA